MTFYKVLSIGLSQSLINYKAYRNRRQVVRIIEATVYKSRNKFSRASNSYYINILIWSLQYLRVKLRHKKTVWYDKEVKLQDN